MADINVERKSGMGWIWWVLGLLLLLLILWWLFARGDDNDDVNALPADTTVSVVEPMPAAGTGDVGMAAAGTAAGAFAFGEIMGDPAAWNGRQVDGEAQVVEVPTDRGFWIESGGQRMFAILNDGPQEVPMHIQVGQTVRIRQATVHSDMNNVPGNLDADTRRILDGQKIFLNVSENNIDVTAGPSANR